MSFDNPDIVHRYTPYPFCVVKCDPREAAILGFGHGFYYVTDDPRWPIYLGPLHDEDFDPETYELSPTGRMSNFTKKGKLPIPTWDALAAANECNRPWSLRVMRYRGETRYTFGFVNETQMVEFKLRW